MALTFKKHQFANGLRLIVHENNNTPMATFHVTYNVGARCENPERTGLAHLLEHYMYYMVKPEMKEQARFEFLRLLEANDVIRIIE
mgnify:CR=1 FL=1